MRFDRRVALIALTLPASAVTWGAQPNQRESIGFASNRTEAAVVARDDAWAGAELRGDVRFVDLLLLTGYRSVGPDGIVHTKADILANTRRNGGSSQARTRVADWKLHHPTATSVRIEGDTAVLTFVAKTKAGKPVSSCDVFVFVSGQWRALYSQHTTAET